MKENNKLAFELMGGLRECWMATKGVQHKTEQSFGNWHMLGLIKHLQVKSGGEVTIGFVAMHLKISLPTASKRISDLEEGGYVTRAMSRTDRRITYVQLTPDGEEIVARNFLAFTERYAAAIDLLGMDKAKELCALLGELKGHLETIVKDEKGGTD